MNRIAVYEPQVGNEELVNLARALSANELIRGPFVQQFERLIAGYVGSDNGVGTNSGTAAIHTALILSGVAPGDEVLITTLTFIAPANAIRYCCAHPVFIDVEPDDWQMSPNAARAFCEERCTIERGRLVNRVTGRPVTTLVLVHFLGMAADVVAFRALAEEFNLTLIEDAAQALGTRVGKQMVGSFGHLGCFSFYGNKLITAGGGGMLVTNDVALAERARHLVNQAKDDPVETRHDVIGYNYRMTNIHGAIGCAQAARIDEHIARKRAIAARYREGLAQLPGITMPAEPPDEFWTYWLSSIRIDVGQFGIASRPLLHALSAQGFETLPVYEPMHLSRAHAGAERSGGTTAEALYSEVLTLPSSIGMTEAEQDQVIAAVHAIRAEARKSQ